MSYHNHDVNVLAAEFVSFTFAVYGFNSGHFTNCFSTGPLNVPIVADTRPCDRAMFKKYTKCPRVCDSADSMLQSMATSEAKSVIQGYTIHTHTFTKHDTEKSFWSVQVAIVKAIREKRSLTSLMACIHPTCNKSLVSGFRRATQRRGWNVSSVDVYYLDLGDSVADSGMFLLAVHKNASIVRKGLKVKIPPSVSPLSLAYFLYKPFNVKEFSLSPARLQNGFENSEFTAQDPISTAAPTKNQRAKCIYYLHHPGVDSNIIAGAGVYSDADFCPPVWASGSNAFVSTFGVETEIDNELFVRPGSGYEVACCFRHNSDLTHFLAHPENFCLLECGIPAKTSKCVIETILRRLADIKNENFQILQPHQVAAPAATAYVPGFVNGAVGSRIPDSRTRRKSLEGDPVTKLLLEIVTNPALGESQQCIQPLDHAYCQPACLGHFSVKDDILYMKEIFQDDDKFVELRVVPTSMRDIIFVAFHATPIGRHLNAYRTYHRIRQRYFRPSMFQYIKRMCSVCPGCNLSNITKNSCADLVYSFPI